MPPKSYRPWSPDEPYLVPPRPRDWLPEGHLVYFLLDFVDVLDLKPIEAAIQAKDPRGVVPYHPGMMVALLLYGYTRGIYSSRRLARATYEDVAVRFLVGPHHPHFTTIAAFRRDHLKALSGLFVDVLRLCEKAGLVKLGHVSVDGTKIQANASKHNAMSYDRMKEDESKLEAEVAALLARAAAQDQEDDARLGAGHDEEDIPAELARREDRLARIRAARAALEDEARAARVAELEALASRNEERAASSPESKEGRAAKTRSENQRSKAERLGSTSPPAEGGSDDDGDDDGPADPNSSGGDDPLPRHKPPHSTDGAPDPKAQRNFTDPDSRIMAKGTEILQGYNAQAAVDADSHVIVAQLLSNQPPDAEYLQPVLAQVEATLGRKPEKASADAGYWSDDNAGWCEMQGIDAYIATSRTRHGPAPPPTPTPSADVDPPPTDPEPEKTRRAKMREKLATKEGHDVYKLRKSTPEPVFGNIKEARGFRRFLLRGLAKVRQEWALVCTAHNLLKLYGAHRAAPAMV